MVAMTPPLNVLCLMVAPLYMCWSNDKKRLLALTNYILIFNYYIHMLIIVLIYIVCNLVLLPFAYLKTVIVKIMLAKRGAINIFSVLSFIVIGLPKLIFL